MSGTLEMADRIARLTLAVFMIIFYALQLITGPFAMSLAILSAMVILAFVTRMVYKWISMD